MRKRPLRSKAAFLLAIGSAALVATACSKGAYPVDIFPEQHYQQSFQRQEPPRLEPPEGAVPVTGRPLAADFEGADNLKNPLPRDQQALERGAELFRVNCSMCHGPQGRGDGVVGTFLSRDGYARPPDLTAQATQSKSDGLIFALLSNGVVVMPKFSLLIDEEGRWSLVHYLRFLTEQGR